MTKAPTWNHNALATDLAGPRYILHPGYVRSSMDGDRHWIGVTQLASLYGVPWKNCVPMYNEKAAYEYRTFGARAGDIHLLPRADGDYRLPDYQEAQ